jgi:DNA (cytosine-5)-methyltransferase 1
VPPIKGGSGLGIPSPPAIFDVATMTASTPVIGDAERLQGFETGWTDIALDERPIKLGARWKMVGNAVSVPVARWLGEELARPSSCLDPALVSPLSEKRAWPSAAFGDANNRYAAAVSTHVKNETHEPIGEFLGLERNPLSKKALSGYVHRALTGTKRFPPEFIEALQKQAEQS